MPDNLLSSWREAAGRCYRAQSAILLGGEKNGANRIDANPHRRPFPRQELRQVNYGGFRGGVGDNSRERNDSGHRRDIDDAAGSTLDHAFSKDLGREQDSANQIQIEDLSPCVELEIAQKSAPGGNVAPGLFPPAALTRILTGPNLGLDRITGRSKGRWIEGIDRLEGRFCRLRR